MSGLSPVEKILKDVFESEETVNKLKRWLEERETANEKYSVPRGKTINLFITIMAESDLLIRHEGVEDVTLLQVGKQIVPAILDIKFRAVTRRNMLTLLRNAYDRNQRVRSKADEILKKVIKDYQEGGWLCAMRPHIKGTKEKGGKLQMQMKGLCGHCPNCLIYGFAVEEEGEFNVKSRIEGDVYYGVIPSAASVTERTGNAVDEATYTTGQALFTTRPILPGTIFVGKIAMHDLTPSEFLLTLFSIATTPRIGARQTCNGKIRIDIPAMILSNHEKGSGYELCKQILQKYEKPGLEEVIQEVNDYVQRIGRNSVVITSRDLADRLRTLPLSDLDEVIIGAWRDAAIMEESIKLMKPSTRGR